MVRSERATLWVRNTADCPIQWGRHDLDELQFDLSDSGDVRVRLHALDTEPGVSNSGRPVLTVTSEHLVKKGWVDALRRVASEDSGASMNMAAFPSYPTGLQDFVVREGLELRRQLARAFGLVRWRNGEWEDRQPVAKPGDPEWSPDGDNWYRLHGKVSIRAKGVPQVELTEGQREALQSLVAQQAEEPVGRQIWHAALAADPVTCVILCVAAVEVETKRYIADAIPEARWLVEELQSPNVHQLLVEFLPTFSEAARETPIPSEQLDALRKGMGLRNTYLHRGPQTGSWASHGLKPQRQDSIVHATSVILAHLDLYRGHAWALSRIPEGVWMGDGVDLVLRLPPEV